MTTYAPTRRPISKVRIGTPALVGVVVALSVPVDGAIAFMSIPRDYHQSHSNTPITGNITSVVVDGGSGEFDIDGSGPVGGASISRNVEWNGDKSRPPVVTETIDGQGVLHLASRCADGPTVAGGSNCGVGWTVRVPAGVPLTATLTDGNVVVRNFVAPFKVTTTDGNIDVKNGGSGDPELHTASGNITAAFTGRPAKITVTSTDGNVAITTDGSPYFDAVTTGGNQLNTNHGSADPNSPGRITVTIKGYGNVTVR